MTSTAAIAAGQLVMTVSYDTAQVYGVTFTINGVWQPTGSGGEVPSVSWTCAAAVPAGGTVVFGPGTYVCETYLEASSAGPGPWRVTFTAPGLDPATATISGAAGRTMHLEGAPGRG